jgi:MFS family permease
MVWKGLSQQQAAMLLSVFAFLGMLSTLFFGWLADQTNKPRMCAAILFSAAGAMLLPIFNDSFWLLALFTLLFSMVEVTYSVGWAIVGDLFGRTHFAKIRGYMGLFYTWGGVVGPVVAGAVFDRWQTYEPLLWLLVVVFSIAGLFFGSLTRAWQRATGYPA